jgi:hypothetical protein
VEGQDVDRAAFASDVERDFDRGQPSGRGQDPNRRLDERGVAGVEESIQGFALPEQPDNQPGVEALSDPIEKPERDAVRPATFDSRDDRPRHTDEIGEILLAPLPPKTQCPDRQPDPDDIHRS